MSKDKITALVPTTMKDAHDLAKVYAASQLLPAELRNKPADVFVTIMAGMELGMAPMAALRSIHIVKGKPVLSADAMVACAQSSGLCEYFRCVESSATVATYETKRKGSEPVRRSFTIEDARTAQLLGNPTWKKYPANMLRARCKADLARDVYPDAVAGVYIHDEAAEFADPAPANGTVTPAAPVDVEPDAIDAEIVEHDDAAVFEQLKRDGNAVSSADALDVWVASVKSAKDEGRVDQVQTDELLAIYRDKKTSIAQGGARA